MTEDKFTENSRILLIEELLTKEIGAKPTPEVLSRYVESYPNPWDVPIMYRLHKKVAENPNSNQLIVGY